MIFQILQIAGEGAREGIANANISNILFGTEATNIVSRTIFGKSSSEGDWRPHGEGFLESLDYCFRDDNPITVNHVKKIQRHNGQVRTYCIGPPDILS